MKKVYLSLLLFLLAGQNSGVIGQIYLIDTVRIDTSKDGWLELVSEVPIQKVWIDSIEFNFFEKPVFKIESGQHTLQVRSRHVENWLIKDFFQTIDIPPDDTLRLSIVFPEYKILQSEPYGAKIFVDSTYLGRTPLLIDGRTLSSAKISLSHSGYLDSTLSNPDQYFPTIMVALRPDLSFQKQKSRTIRLQLNRKRRQRNYALLTFGLGLASGVTAYLAKKEADHNYDRYLLADNPSKMNHLFKTTERYDRLAAGSYMIFELNMLASAYLFFRYLIKN